MIIPIRCQSCGKPIAHQYAEFKRRVAANEDPAKVMTDLGIIRHCCRSHFLSNVDVLPLVARFRKV